jgi:hypothetical protein
VGWLERVGRPQHGRPLPAGDRRLAGDRSGQRAGWPRCPTAARPTQRCGRATR